MTFDEALAQVSALLQREGRVSYRALKRRFNLDDEYTGLVVVGEIGSSEKRELLALGETPNIAARILRISKAQHCHSYLTWTLWLLGYPDQALKRNNEALTLAHELAQPFSLAFAFVWAAPLHQSRCWGSHPRMGGSSSRPRHRARVCPNNSMRADIARLGIGCSRLVYGRLRYERSARGEGDADRTIYGLILTYPSWRTAET